MNYKLTTLFLILIVASEANAKPVWGGWDQANSVAKVGAFLVIRQPDRGFCYVKQGYDGNSDKLELIMKEDNIPILISPFFQGIEGGITYWVDKGPVRRIPAGPTLDLSSDLLPELKRGAILTIKFKPIGHRIMQQNFSLSGFTKAYKWLGNSACKEIVSDKY